MTEHSSVLELPVAACSSDQVVVVAESAIDDEPSILEEDATHLAVGAVAWSRPHVEADLVLVADVDEVEWLERDRALTVMRELHSFGHAVRLSFHAPELVFYAAIYMDELLWRAVKSTEFGLIEKAFEEYVTQVNSRARAEVLRLQLEARNVQLKRRIAEYEVRAERLRANIQRNAAQKQRANERENLLRNDIKQLESTRVQAQLHAGRTLRQVGQLQSNCATDLPRLRSPGLGLRRR